MFNDVLEKMIIGDDKKAKISNQADDYENMQRGFSSQLAIKQQKDKSPILWWGAFGGVALELQAFARRIIGLCCSVFGCERNWSTFEFIRTKKRNRLEHKRLNDMIYIQYNRKITNWFQRMQEEGRNFNPLILDDFQWDNEWVDIGAEEVHLGNDDLTWAHIDEAISALSALRGRNFRRRAHSEVIGYSRRATRATRVVDDKSEPDNKDDGGDDNFVLDDEDVDDFGESPPSPTHESGEPSGNASHFDNLELDDI